MQPADFLEALDSFIAILSRGGGDVDQWRREVTEASHVLNSATGRMALDGYPLEWVKFGPFRQFFDGHIAPLYLDTFGTGVIAPRPTPRPILQELRAFAKSFRGPMPKRRRAVKPRELRHLTVPQTEAVQIVGECNGNVAEAARRLGKDRKTVDELYKTGLKKLGKEAVKRGTRTFPRDRRGQVDLAEGDDRRG